MFIVSVSILLFGLAMVLGTLFIELSPITRMMLTMLGACLASMSIPLMAISRWYHKASAEEAIVRTGSGGIKVIVDGGILVLPTLHKLIRVPLSVRKLVFDLTGTDGLVTKDKSQFDVHSEFYVRVGATPEQVLNASRLFGEQSAVDNVFEDMMRTKLVNVMRSVAAKYDQAELNSDGEVFSSSVNELVSKNIEQDGLILETAAISKTPIIGI